MVPFMTQRFSSAIGWHRLPFFVLDVLFIASDGKAIGKSSIMKLVFFFMLFVMYFLVDFHQEDYI